jgi:hypothetical protein
MAEEHDLGSHGGRPTSWIAVVVMVAGFAIGGVGLVAGPSWPTFWVGAAAVVAGGAFGLAVGILGDVVVDAPRVIPELTDTSPPRPDTSPLGAEGDGRPRETIERSVRADPQELPHG